MKYAQDYHVVPLVLASTTDTAALPMVDMSKYLWADFLIGIGTCAGDTVDVTVETCTAASTAGASLVAIPFRYKLTSAVGADAIGALTTADSAGFAMDSDDEGKALLIGVDPKDFDDGYRFCRVKFAQSSSTSGFVVQAFALLAPRYAADTMISSS